MNKFYRPFHLSIVISLLFIGSSYCAEFALKINNWAMGKKLNLDSPALTQDNPINEQQEIHDFVLQTGSGIKVPVKYYDRHSDVVVIAGGPLPAPKEYMKKYAKLFNSYDVVLFDYRWSNRYGTSLFKAIISGSPVSKLLLQETEEIITVLNFVMNSKKYRRVVGLGSCYSTFLCAKAQYDQVKQNSENRFTHLILDSTWPSLKLFTERIFFDPFLPINPCNGGAPWWIKAISNNKYFKAFMMFLIFKILPDPKTTQYLSALEIPILFIHGINDLFVPQEHFEKAWEATNSKYRAVLLTPYQHCNNLCNKRVYRYICEQFIKTESTIAFADACADLF